METWTELLLDDLGEKFEKAIMKLFNHENCGLKILLLDPEKDDLVRERQNALNSGKKPSEYINVKEKICLSSSHSSLSSSSSCLSSSMLPS